MNTTRTKVDTGITCPICYYVNTLEEAMKPEFEYVYPMIAVCKDCEGTFKLTLEWKEPHIGSVWFAEDVHGDEKEHA